MVSTQPTTQATAKEHTNRSGNTHPLPRAFADTVLGQLPTETLQIITRCLVPRELATLARVSHM